MSTRKLQRRYGDLSKNPECSVLGISTCWRSRSTADGREIISSIAELGIKSVELDWRLPEKTLHEAVAELEKLGLTLTSLHAPLPAPNKSGHYAGGALLTSCNEDERKAGVREVKNSLLLANDIGAKVVIIHSGHVPMDNATSLLQKLYDEGKTGSPEGIQIINRLKIERLSKRGNGFNQLMKSLDELNEVACKLGIYIGIENRYHINEYPNFEELAIIFLALQGGGLRYWHDTGHAQAQENLGVVPHTTYLAEYSDLLIGVHLHDTNGYTDHNAIPSGGPGMVDFAMVKKYLKPGTIKTFEPRGDIERDKVKSSFNRLMAEGLG